MRKKKHTHIRLRLPRAFVVITLIAVRREEAAYRIAIAVGPFDMAVPTDAFGPKGTIVEIQHLASGTRPFKEVYDMTFKQVIENVDGFITDGKAVLSNV